MKARKVFKILILFLIILMIFMLAPKNVLASVWNDDDYGSLTQFDNYTSQNGWVKVDNIINTSMSKVLTIIRTIAICVAVIVILIIGITYMAGRPEHKAELKKRMPIYITGVCILFAAVGILTLLSYFINDTMPIGD